MDKSTTVDCTLLAVCVKSFLIGVQSDGANAPTPAVRTNESEEAAQHLRDNPRVRHVFFHDFVEASIRMGESVVQLVSHPINRSARYIAGKPVIKDEIMSQPELLGYGVERMLAYAPENAIFVLFREKFIYPYEKQEGDQFITD